MRILFLSPRQCWPPVTGAKLREYHLAKALGRHANLTHVFFTHGDSAPRPADLPFCNRIVPVLRPPLYTLSKVVRGFLSRWPLPILNYFSREMSAALDALLTGEQFDLIHLDSLHMGAYIPLIEQRTQAPIVFDWHNIESEAMRRYSEGAKSPAKKTYAALTARRLADFEQYALRKGMGHAVCSVREREQLTRLRPAARIAVVENGVDTRAFPEGAAPAERNRILFVGSMNYHPNVDAVVFFAKAVWPRIQRQFPNWRFTVVGYDPAPAVLALRGEAGIEVTGTVPDVRPYYAEALASVVPLRSGAGTRLKILEAMAAGTPVISSALGAEGLAVTPGKDILMAESREEWMAQLAALQPQGELWDRIAGGGRKLARARYDWDSIGDSLYENYSSWLKAVNQ